MGLISTAAKVAVASSVHGRVQRRQQQRWARQNQAEGLQAAPHTAPAQPSAASMDTKLAQLTQLGELRNAGILTDAEFEAKKTLILAG